METPQLDDQDMELMKCLQELGPLLQGTRKWEAESEDGHLSKRHKPVVPEARRPQDDATQKALLGLVKIMGNVILAHEKALQNVQRQDCYVLFMQHNPQGGLPILQTLAQDWRQKAPTKGDDPKWPTLRNYLFQGLMGELQARVVQLSQSSQGQTLWDTAVKKGTIREDGSWTFTRWSKESQSLVPAATAPYQMDRRLKTLQTIQTLLQDNEHVIRFHSLRATSSMTPWVLQICLRDSELWHLLSGLTHCSLWGMMGMAVKHHNQTMSKPAQTLQTLLGKGAKSSGKGSPKGSSKGKSKQQQAQPVWPGITSTP